MQAVFLFLGKYEVIIYLLLLLASLFVFRWLWNAWREWRQAYFSLEREITMRRLARYAVFAALILILACAQTIIASFIVPGLPASALVGTPTIDLLAIPGAGSESGTMSAFTPASIAPAPGSEGCVPGQVEIISPKNGDTVSGVVEISGTVNVPNFGFYKYEFATPGSEMARSPARALTIPATVRRDGSSSGSERPTTASSMSVFNWLTVYFEALRDLGSRARAAIIRRACEKLFVVTKPSSKASIKMFCKALSSVLATWVANRIGNTPCSTPWIRRSSPCSTKRM